MKNLLYIIPFFLCINLYSQKIDGNFFDKNYQKLKIQFFNKNLTFPPKNVFIRVFKHERVLELWVVDSVCNQYKLFKTYKVCMNSGVLGPKRKEGDLQIPEGFYHITRLKTTTNYHLALKINYPNESDIILGNKYMPGGEIYIHGECVSIGCVSVSNNDIEEIFTLVKLVKNWGEVQVHIFPVNFDNKCNYEFLYEKIKTNDSVIYFEKNIQNGFNFFQKNHVVPNYTIDDDGFYIFY